MQRGDPPGDIPRTILNLKAQRGAIRLPWEEVVVCRRLNTWVRTCKAHTGLPSSWDTGAASVGRAVQTAVNVCWGNANREANPPNRARKVFRDNQDKKDGKNSHLLKLVSQAQLKAFMCVNTGALCILRWGNRSSERSSHLPKPTQPEGCGVRIQTYSSAFKGKTWKNLPCLN